MQSATPSTEYATDTMGLVLWIERRRLGLQARAIFQAAEESSVVLYIPAIVFAEVLYLSERNRIKATLDDVADLLANFTSYREQPLTFEIIRATARLSDIPELHDPLIAGTALALAIPLITNDPQIQASSAVQTIWS